MAGRRPVPWGRVSGNPVSRKQVPWGELASVAVPLLAVLVPVARMLGTGALPMEEGNILAVAAGILDGRLPHADVG